MYIYKCSLFTNKTSTGLSPPEISTRTVIVSSPADEMKDLELMLAPLRRLPAVSGIAPEVDPYLKARPEPLEVQVLLELDPRAPATDFVRQLFELAYQLSTSGGIAIPRGVLLIAGRLLRHAETITEAWSPTSPRGEK